jgi:hypothetical protein
MRLLGSNRDVLQDIVLVDDEMENTNFALI